jgi:superfamily I DNA/RNA helicase
VTKAERCKDTGLFLSFTKAAATEALSRINNAGIKASTIHSYMFSQLGLSKSSVVDEKKMAEFGRATGIPFKGSEPGSDERQEGDDYASIFAYANNHITDLGQAYDHFGRPGTLKRFENFVSSYTSWKRTFGYMDFDDMLTRGMEADIIRPDVVFLDEAQDCSPLQWAVFENISRCAKRVFIAGDDDQAIYEWNGADPHGMIRFTENHGGNYKVLDHSYRCPIQILDLAKEKALKEIKTRVDKDFSPSGGVGVVRRYGDTLNFDLSSFAKDGGGMILCRDRWRLDEIRMALNRELIPYRMPGGSSPWTSRIASQLREGGTPEIAPHWQEFYRQADLSQPINISLSTIHQAKGHEAENVVLDLTLSNQVLQNLYKDRDAELRVMYVAMTRASKVLNLCGSNPLL